MPRKKSNKISVKETVIKTNRRGRQKSGPRTRSGYQNNGRDVELISPSRSQTSAKKKCDICSTSGSRLDRNTNCLTCRSCSMVIYHWKKSTYQTICVTGSNSCLIGETNPVKCRHCRLQKYIMLSESTSLTQSVPTPDNEVSISMVDKNQADLSTDMGSSRADTIIYQQEDDDDTEDEFLGFTADFYGNCKFLRPGSNKRKSLTEEGPLFNRPSDRNELFPGNILDDHMDLGLNLNDNNEISQVPAGPTRLVSTYRYVYDECADDSSLNIDVVDAYESSLTKRNLTIILEPYEIIVEQRHLMSLGEDPLNGSDEYLNHKHPMSVIDFGEDCD